MTCSFLPQNFLSFQAFAFLRDWPKSKLKLIRDNFFFSLCILINSLPQSSTELWLDHYQYLQQPASLHLLHVHRKAGWASFNTPNPFFSLLCIAFFFFLFLTFSLAALQSQETGPPEKGHLTHFSVPKKDQIYEIVLPHYEKVYFCFINKTFFILPLIYN